MNALLSVLSYGFGAIVRARTALYDRRLLSIDRAERPVISVGNLAIAGSGKTPFTILLANLLLARGERVVVVSRGYGAKTPPRTAAILSRGAGPLLDVEIGGDEPTLIAHKTRAAVIVAKKRIDGARLAMRELDPTVFLLDDGFQHRRLARDLDIVLLDAQDPFHGGHLLPRGRLREPPSALARAHLLVLVGGSNGAAALERPHLRVVARPVTEGLELRGRRTALLAAIERPQRFERTVRELGAEVVHTHFLRDHTWFTREDLENFHRRAREKGAELFLTTEKDAVRLPPDLQNTLRALPIVHEIAEGQELLERALDQCLPRKV